MADTLCSLLLESALQQPDRKAIIQADKSITYQYLVAWSASIAVYLNDNGLQKGNRVAVLVQNSAEYVAIYYGVLAAGGVVVALNTETKSRDLSNWVLHSEANWLFAESAHVELKSLLLKLPENIKVVEVGEPSLHRGSSIHANLSNILDANKGELQNMATIANDDLASIIYTSGTTGQPKGVMLSHRNIYTNTRSILDYMQLQNTDKVMNILPFYYSYGNSVLHTHLAAGASIVLENSMMYPHQVMQQIVEQKVSVLPGVPSTFALLLNRIKLENYDLSSLRYITQAGGPMSAANIERLRKAVPNAALFVMYGQTEASARLTFLPPNRLEQKMGSVGVSIPNVLMEIRDEHGNLAVNGETGEIWANGDNIMQGYWKDAGMTANVLVDGWLKTGDLAYKDEDGYYYIVGRSSEMIKSGAHRINPAEIEEVIAELDEIAEVVVVGIEDEMLGQVIKSVVVLKPDCKLDRKTLMAYCQNYLASYKIPKVVVFVDEIPKTASGKIRRYKLQ